MDKTNREYFTQTTCKKCLLCLFVCIKVLCDSCITYGLQHGVDLLHEKTQIGNPPPSFRRCLAKEVLFLQALKQVYNPELKAL